jgi:hypothetical protein
MQAPLSYRWLRANGVTRLVPWYFIDEEEGRFASQQFAKEHLGGPAIYTFARRQDCDDFAGFTVTDGIATDQVIYYHPSFSGGPNSHLISGTYPDLWAFLREVVIPDSATWFSEADIDELEQEER